MKLISLLALASVAAALPAYEVRSPKIGWCGNRPCITKREPAETGEDSAQIGWCGTRVCITKREPEESTAQEDDGEVSAKIGWCGTRTCVTKRQPEPEPEPEESTAQEDDGEVSAKIGWCGNRVCITKREPEESASEQEDGEVSAKIGWCGTRTCVTKREAVPQSPCCFQRGRTVAPQGSQFRLTITPHEVDELTESWGGLMSPFYADRKLYDLSSEDGWKEQRSAQIIVGLASDCLALVLALFITVVAAVPRLLRKKSVDNSGRKTLFLLVAAFGLLPTTFFRLIISAHYIFYNWNVVADEGEWLQWYNSFTFDDNGISPISTT
ncbi:uncharacterized protein EI97DRAFT_443267 [Westerdykella ornata]|uniref:Uncharacterized protein n=1 Tax=Westerdykella ornata TaxID=318751 RepID=A0A6A6JGL2_WESOR|nr:uncharacterized protein EI97DRAFT_443267 [Westerdykella ornata]KAF2275405.1 hypothetical protein EI97DRAFT_443267 [Westerdykella ornata]